MKSFFKILSFLLLFSGSASTQNLVPNSSFEEYTICPNGGSCINLLTGNFININSSDYFNACNIYGSVSIPINNFGNKCPRTGLGYTGLFSHIFNGGSREFLGITLNSSLTTGNKYYCKFSIVLSQISGRASNKFGILFMTDTFPSDSLISIFPDPFVYNFSHIVVDSIIQSKNNWIDIFASFTADSAYRTALFGCFCDYQNVDTIAYTTNTYNFSYYHIDNVCISEDSSYCYNFNPQFINILSSSDTIIEGQSMSFNAISDLAYEQAEWLFTGGIPSNAWGQNVNNVTYYVAGVYPVTIIGHYCGYGGCCADTIVFDNYITVVKGAGYSSPELKNNNVFINAENGNLSVSVTKKGNYSIGITDITGRIICRKNFSGTVYNSDISDLPAGIYNIWLHNNHCLLVSKKVLLFN